MAATQQPSPPTATPVRINATRPENLGPSTKRTSKAQLLLQYQQLLPLQPAHKRRILDLVLPSFLFATTATNPLAQPRIPAVWDSLLQAVAVNDDHHMTRLWRQGFFGKGFLSRSEPSWRRRVDNRIAEHQGRSDKRLTAEEVTALRRIERKGTKLAKKLERDAERLLAASTATSAAGSPRPATAAALVPAAADLAPRLERIQDDKGKGKAVVDAPVDAGPAPEVEAEADEQDPAPPAWHLDAEHSQLQPEEAFFLVFALDALSLTVSDPLADLDPASPPPRPLSILAAFRLFLEAACPALLPLPASLSPSPSSPPSPSPPYDPRLARLDSPFLVSYAAYHHFRSMGWVVRSGVKFCVDWVLYGQGGPVGGHAECVSISLNLVRPCEATGADSASPSPPSSSYSPPFIPSPPRPLFLASPRPRPPSPSPPPSQVRRPRPPDVRRPGRRRVQPVPVALGARRRPRRCRRGRDGRRGAPPGRGREEELVEVVPHGEPGVLGRQEGALRALGPPSLSSLPSSAPHLDLPLSLVAPLHSRSHLPARAGSSSAPH